MMSGDAGLRFRVSPIALLRKVKSVLSQLERRDR
jgi:hypothetical protein